MTKVMVLVCVSDASIGRLVLDEERLVCSRKWSKLRMQTTLTTETHSRGRYVRRGWQRTACFLEAVRTSQASSPEARVNSRIPQGTRLSVGW